jgi:uncharacterized membrane protein SpoIIM required for sporulation
MTPATFTALHEAKWQRLETLLAQRGTQAAEFPALYREVCLHLALARERHYPHELVARLNRLALDGQQWLYRPRDALRERVLAFLTGGFAAQVRAQAGPFWLASACFWLPFLLCAAATWLAPWLAYSVLEPEQVLQFEAMYDADGPVGYERGDDDNLLMFGYYVYNNISIAFRTFAAGIFAGVGALFFLSFNGMFFGIVAGYLTAAGSGERFWSFVCGHGAFELTAIVLSGMAGLLLGRALVSPGRLRRIDALVAAGRTAIPVVYGAAFMLLIAAVIEAFWSSQAVIPPPVKYGMAALWWTLVVLYFLRAGRGAAHAS